MAVGDERSRATNSSRLRISVACASIFLIAGCSAGVTFPGGPSRTPSPRPTPPLVTIPPELTFAPPSGSAIPQRSPTAEEAEAIDAFIATAASSGSRFHVTADGNAVGQAAAETARLVIEVAGDVAGDDFDGHMAVGSLGRVRVKIVDGVGYGRLPDGKWMTAPDFEQTQPINPFQGLVATDVEYVGAARGNDRLTRLRVTKWVGGDVASTGVTDARLENNSLEVVVRRDGTPVEATLDFTIVGRLGARETRLVYHVEYEFSRFGDRIVIEAPRV